MSSSRFYDDFLSSQIESGINDRIYRLFQKVVAIGLKKNEQVLEIGCGIGALTFLLAKKTGRGRLEAFDPSPKSIAFAKERIRQHHVHFSVGDITTYTPQQASAFDKIILFDVLEHIPVDDHLSVFKKIASLLKTDGLLLINLPNPAYILYDMAHQPQVLQEVDQPVFLHQLLPKLQDAKLELVLFDTHSVWVRDDYHFLVVRKQQEFREHPLSRDRNLFQKGSLRLQRAFRRLRYRFP